MAAGNSHSTSSSKWAAFRRNDKSVDNGGNNGNGRGATAGLGGNTNSKSSTGNGAKHDELSTMTSENEVAISDSGLSPFRERLLFMCQALIGVMVKTQLKNGIVYEGVLHTIKVEDGDFEVMLKMAIKKTDVWGKRALPNKPAEGDVYFFDELI